MGETVATTTPGDERFTLVAGGRIQGTITAGQARLCAEWLRRNVDMPALVEFFDGIAGDGNGRSDDPC